MALRVGGAGTEVLFKPDSNFRVGGAGAQVLALEDNEPAEGTTIYLSSPTDGTTVASTTIAAFGTAWTDSVTVSENEAVLYQVQVSYQLNASTWANFALYEGSTMIARCNAYAFATSVEHVAHMYGVYIPDSTGSKTFEVRGASPSGTITLSSVSETSTSIDLTDDGMSQMMLELIPINSVVEYQPRTQVTRTSATLGSMTEPWTTEIIVGSGESIRYDIKVPYQTSGNERVYAALMVEGTMVDRTQWYSGGGDVEQQMLLRGIYSPGAASTYTCEVYIASNSGTITYVQPTMSTSTSTANNTDKGAQMVLEAVTTPT